MILKILVYLRFQSTAYCMYASKTKFKHYAKNIAYLDLCEMNGPCYSTYCDIICHSRKRVFLSSYIKDKWVPL